jgi:hypothetical protein
MTEPQGFIVNKLLEVFKRWVAETIHEYSDNPDLMRIALLGHLGTLDRMADATSTTIDDTVVSLIRSAVNNDTIWRAFVGVVQGAVSFLDSWLENTVSGTVISEPDLIEAMKKDSNLVSAVKAYPETVHDPKFGWETIIITLAPIILEMLKKWWEKRHPNPVV